MNLFSASKFLLYLIPFTVIIVTSGTIFPFIVGKYVAFRLLVGISLILFLIGIVLDKERSNEYWSKIGESIKSPLGIALGIFTIIFVLAGFFGIDPSYSFWSNFERGEGGLQILFLYTFFILLATFLKTEKDWKNFFTTFIVSAFLAVMYGLGDGLNLLMGPSESLSSITRFSGSLGNSSYLATYLLFAMFFASYLLLSEKQNPKKGKKYLLISSIVIFIFFFFWAATRGAFLGLVGAAVVGIIYLFIIKKNWRKPIGISALLLILLLSAGFYFRDNPKFDQIPGSRIFDISLQEETLQHRMIMWGITVDAVKDRPLLGYGPENFDHIFYEYYDPRYYDPVSNGVGNFGSWFDRAHSTTFDYLSQTGILGLMSYWAIFAIFFLLFAKSKLHKRESATLATLMLVMPVAYLIQGQVLFEVLTIYIPFYSFLAFSSFKLNLENNNQNHEQ